MSSIDWTCRSFHRANQLMSVDIRTNLNQILDSSLKSLVFARSNEAFKDKIEVTYAAIPSTWAF